jgi:nicotinamidase-related amidase
MTETAPSPKADRLLAIADPAHTVVVTMELQKGIVGDEAILPALPIAVREAGLLDVASRVCAAGRAKGVPILHATMRERPDGLGQAVNCKIFAIAAKRRAETGHNPTDRDQPGAELADELNVAPTDFEVPRSTGMTPFTSTELNQIIRNLGGKTIVLMGVSLNLGIIGSALSAIDLGYQVVVVRDAVVGLPREYAEAVLQNSIAMIATIVTSEELLAAWSVSSGSSAVSSAK